MAKARKGSQDKDSVVEVLKNILIAQLAVAGLPQQNIRKIVGVNNNRVSAIVRHVTSARGAGGRTNK